MTGFLRSLITCSAAMTAVLLLLALLTPVLSKRYPARALRMAWGVAALGLLVPLRPLVRIPAASPVSEAAAFTLTAQSPGAAVQAVAQQSSRASGVGLLSAVWLAGAAAVLAAHLLAHARFLRLVSRWGAPEREEETLALLDELRGGLGMRREVRLLRCPCVTGPMAAGLLHPAILLPEGGMAREHMRLYLKHELLHLRRGDLWYQALLLAARSLHWFNPAVYLMARLASEACERACDEAVLAGTGPEQRRQYAGALLTMAEWGRGRADLLTTGFLGGKGGMRRRVSAVLDGAPRRAGSLCVALTVLLTLLAGTGFATVPAKAEPEEKPFQKVQFDEVGEGDTVKIGPYELTEGETYSATAEWTGPKGPLTLSVLDENGKQVGEKRQVKNNEAFQVEVSRTGAYRFLFESLEKAEDWGFQLNVMKAGRTLAEKLLPFAGFGLQYDEAQEVLYYNGARVKVFYDIRPDGSFNIGYHDLKAQSALYLETVLDEAGNVMDVRRMSKETEQAVFGEEDYSPYVLDATLSNPKKRISATDKQDMEIPESVQKWLADVGKGPRIYEVTGDGLLHTWFYADMGDRLAWLLETNGMGNTLYLYSKYRGERMQGPTLIHCEYPEEYGTLQVVLDDEPLEVVRD